MRCCLLNGVTCGDVRTGLLPVNFCISAYLPASALAASALLLNSSGKAFESYARRLAMTTSVPFFENSSTIRKTNAAAATSDHSDLSLQSALETLRYVLRQMSQHVALEWQ